MKRGRVIAAVMVGVMAVWLFGSWVLRRIPIFDVRQVEFTGLETLGPDQLLSVLDLSEGRSVFGDNSGLERQLEESGLVRRARVGRRLPSTLQIEVEERIPVALVPSDSGLRVVDRYGVVLPLDPSGAELDLPVLLTADSLTAGVLYTVLAADPALFQDIAGGHSVGSAVTVTTSAGQIVFGPVVTQDLVESVSAVRRHAQSTGEEFDEIDARFSGWVVVRKTQS